MDGPEEQQLHRSLAPAHDPPDLPVLEASFELEQDRVPLVERQAAHRGMQFVTEQLAGDLQNAKTPEERYWQLVATAFLLLGPTNFERQDKPLLEMDVIDEGTLRMTHLKDDIWGDCEVWSRLATDPDPFAEATP